MQQLFQNKYFHRIKQSIKFRRYVFVFGVVAMYTDDICSGTYILHNNTFVVIIQNITFLDNI